MSIEHKASSSDPDGDKPHPNTCPKCGSHYRDDELDANLRVCPHCGHHFAVQAPQRIEQFADADTFVEEAADLRSDDPLDFFDLRPYTERLAEAEVITGLGEAMVIGRATIDGPPVPARSHGLRLHGRLDGPRRREKFALACESAADAWLPLVSVTASGGARMQEGILSLMQLPKTVCAVEDLYDAGGSMLNVLAHPTTGGVLASFASSWRRVVAEPGALMSFAGPRVVASLRARSCPRTSAAPSPTTASATWTRSSRAVS